MSSIVLQGFLVSMGKQCKPDLKAKLA